MKDQQKNIQKNMNNDERKKNILTSFEFNLLNMQNVKYFNSCKKFN